MFVTSYVKIQLLKKRAHKKGRTVKKYFTEDIYDCYNYDKTNYNFHYVTNV